jgi:hypothetical protein
LSPAGAAVTADTALRFGRYFGASADLWLNLEKTYDLDRARTAIGRSLKRIPQRPASEPKSDAIRDGALARFRRRHDHAAWDPGAASAARWAGSPTRS